MQFIVDNPIFNLSCIRIQVSNFFLQKWVTVFCMVLGLFSTKGMNQSLTVKFNLRSKALPKATKTASVNLSCNAKYVRNLKGTKADVYQKLLQKYAEIKHKSYISIRSKGKEDQNTQREKWKLAKPAQRERKTLSAEAIVPEVPNIIL